MQLYIRKSMHYFPYVLYVENQSVTPPIIALLLSLPPCIHLPQRQLIDCCDDYAQHASRQQKHKRTYSSDSNSQVAALCCDAKQKSVKNL